MTFVCLLRRAIGELRACYHRRNRALALCAFVGRLQLLADVQRNIAECACAVGGAVDR